MNNSQPDFHLRYGCKEVNPEELREMPAHLVSAVLTVGELHWMALGGTLPALRILRSPVEQVNVLVGDPTTYMQDHPLSKLFSLK